MTTLANVVEFQWTTCAESALNPCNECEAGVTFGVCEELSFRNTFSEQNDNGFVQSLLRPPLPSPDKASKGRNVQYFMSYLQFFRP